MTVRRAAFADLDWLLGELREFSAFYATRRQLFGDEAYARVALRRMITDHLVLIAEAKGGERVGLISGWLYPHPFNPEIKTLSETFWWVATQFKNTFIGGRAAQLLLDAFIEQGKARAQWIVFMLAHNTQVNERALLRRGFRLQERAYLMEVL